MQFKYEAVNNEGYTFVRDAKVVGELPHQLRLKTLEIGAQEVAQYLGLKYSDPNKLRPSFGIPLYQSFGLNKSEALKSVHSDILLKTGSELPLNLFSRFVNHFEPENFYFGESAERISFYKTFGQYQLFTVMGLPEEIKLAVFSGKQCQWTFAHVEFCKIELLGNKSGNLRNQYDPRLLVQWRDDQGVDGRVGFVNPHEWLDSILRKQFDLKTA